MVGMGRRFKRTGNVCRMRLGGNRGEGYRQQREHDSIEKGRAAMSERLTNIPAAPCRLCGSNPVIMSADNEPFCEIGCCNHEGAIDITLTCDCGSDGADCERRAIELWNELNGCCETCTHFECGACFREEPLPVMPSWGCEHYEVR